MFFRGVLTVDSILILWPGFKISLKEAFGLSVLSLRPLYTIVKRLLREMCLYLVCDETYQLRLSLGVPFPIIEFLLLLGLILWSRYKDSIEEHEIKCLSFKGQD